MKCGVGRLQAGSEVRVTKNCTHLPNQAHAWINHERGMKMSNIAALLVRGAVRTNGIYEIGEQTLRSLAAKIISGDYRDELMSAVAPCGI